MSSIIYRFFVGWYICGLILLTFNLLPTWLEWANTVFLMTAGMVSAIYFIKLYRPVRGTLYSLSIFAISIFVEHLGVTYNFLFGSYAYNGNFGLKIFDTPLTIGFAWLLIIGCSHEIARGITAGWKGISGNGAFIITGGLIAVTMDLILDPVSYKVKEYWIWHDPGLYYDIPISNFIGWFVLAALFHLVFVLWFHEEQPHTDYSDLWSARMRMVFGMIMLMFCIIALTGQLFGAVFLVSWLTACWYGIYFWRKKYYVTS